MNSNSNEGSGSNVTLNAEKLNHAEKSNRQFRVIKIGGSLFSLPDLKERIEAWSHTISDARYINVWLPGGGELVEEVRRWESRHGLEPLTSHSISIDLLASTARLFHSLFEDWTLERSFHTLLQRHSQPMSNIVFDCSDWAKVNADLERSWNTTSDTIALELAGSLHATRLVLLKSATPISCSAAEVSAAGIVDANFCSAWSRNSRIPISMTNLRGDFESLDLEQ